eukprot:GFYU01012416.1.p1 GENE.GFYU01012416.1~~GFYU01012416.1.p1  ORF type:complete len:228 (-),score=47.03 GFYU01012416.1:265-948(-)
MGRRKDEAEWIMEQNAEHEKQQHEKMIREMRDVVAGKCTASAVYLYAHSTYPYNLQIDDPEAYFSGLASMTTLQEITFYGLKNGRDTWRTFVKHLPDIVASNRRFSSIFLGDLPLKDDLVSQICAYLTKEHCPKLSSIDFTLTGIKDDGAKAVAELLKKNKNIQRVGLRANSIGKDGKEALLESLSVNNLCDYMDVGTSPATKALDDKIKAMLGDMKRKDRGLLDRL